MISTNDFHIGVTIELEGEVFTVTDFQHVKPGKGGAFVRTKLKNIETGHQFNKTFRAGEKVKQAHVETRDVQFLYRSGDEFVFMDLDTYEQSYLDRETVEDTSDYLSENQKLKIQFYKERAIGIQLPPNVELKIKDTTPGVKGNTVSGGTKPAELETGLTLQVPLFINEGELIRVDTRSGEYIERV